MEIRGEEFIKNLEIEKEKVRLQEQTDSLDAQKQQTLFKSSNENINPDTNQDDPFQNLDDIVLENNNNNKQKYIIFGFALILLFLITIITIRLVQEPKTQADFTTEPKIEEVATKQIHETKATIKKSLNIDEIVQAEEDIQTVQVDKPKVEKRENTSDIFGIENKVKKIETKKDEVVIIQEKQLKKPTITKREKITPKKIDILKQTQIKEINLKEKFVNNKGYFIQVGAFTKNINKKLLKTLNRSKYKYIEHKMTINGRVYNKVLVGSYKSSNDAKKDLEDVRKLIHNSKAYVMRLK